MNASSPWGARIACSPARMVEPAIGRSWPAWSRPRSSTGSSPWGGSPMCSSGWSRAAPRPTRSSGSCHGPGRPSSSQLWSMPESRGGQTTLAEGLRPVQETLARLGTTAMTPNPIELRDVDGQPLPAKGKGSLYRGITYVAGCTRSPTFPGCPRPSLLHEPGIR
jgi:hypothetical protein